LFFLNISYTILPLITEIDRDYKGMNKSRIFSVLSD
jgi:hypothetical protein